MNKWTYRRITNNSTWTQQTWEFQMRGCVCKCLPSSEGRVWLEGGHLRRGGPCSESCQAIKWNETVWRLPTDVPQNGQIDAHYGHFGIIDRTVYTGHSYHTNVIIILPSCHCWLVITAYPLVLKAQFHRLSLSVCCVCSVCVSVATERLLG